MSDLEKMLKDVVMGGIGAVAVALEKADGLARNLVEKGEETVKANQDTINELRDRLKDARVTMQDVQVDVEKMTREAREELRRRLDFLDELDARRAEEDAACEEEPVEEVPAEEASVEDDVPVLVVEPEEDDESNG